MDQDSEDRDLIQGLIKAHKTYFESQLQQAKQGQIQQDHQQLTSCDSNDELKFQTQQVQKSSNNLNSFQRQSNNAVVIETQPAVTRNESLKPDINTNLLLVQSTEPQHHFTTTNINSRNQVKAQTQSGTVPVTSSLQRMAALDTISTRQKEAILSDIASLNQQQLIAPENMRQLLQKSSQIQQKQHRASIMSSIDFSTQQHQMYQSIGSEYESTTGGAQQEIQISLQPDMSTKTTVLATTHNHNQQMEDTGKLKTMAEVDVDRINRERNDKLQTILNSNIEQRETQCTEAHTTFQRQQNKAQALQKHLNEVRQQVQMLKSHDLHQKEQINDRRQTLLKQKEDVLSRSEVEKVQMIQFLTKAQQRSLRLAKEKKEMQKVVHEQTEIQRSLKSRLEALKKRENSLIEKEVSQLRREDQKLIDQIEVLRNAELTLDTFINEQQEQYYMLEEDLACSSQQEQSLVIQRENIETYCDQLKDKLSYGCKWTLSLQKAYEQQQSEESLMQCIIDSQMRLLVMNLIRELQQYMLSNASGTTDQSTLQSQVLENYESDAEKPQIPIDQTLNKVIEFASTNFNLDLSTEQMQLKIQHIKTSVNLQRIKQQLSSIGSLTKQIAKIQESITVLQRRVSNEIRPLSEAMKETNTVLQNERVKTRDTISGLASQHREVKDMIRACHETFLQKAEGLHLQSQIKSLQTEIKLISESISNKECNVDSVETEVKATQEEVKDMQTKIQSLQETTRIQTDQIQLDIAKIGESTSNESMVDQQLAQLQDLEQKLQYELQSAQNRLRYAQQKVKGAQESLYHAKGVLHDQTPEQEQIRRQDDKNQSQSSSILQRPDSQLQSTTSMLQDPVTTTQIPSRNKSPIESSHQALKMALMRQSASHSSLPPSIENPEGTKNQQQTMQSAAIVPGLLTSIVKQVRKSTRTENKVNLAELLRQSIQMSTQSADIQKGEYCTVAPDLRLKQKAMQQRAQTQIEPDFVVDTERLLAGRKDKTLRYGSIDNQNAAAQAHHHYQSSVVAYTNDSNNLLHAPSTTFDQQKSSFASQPPQQTLNHHRTITPNIAVSELDRSGSLANFKSAEPIYRQQEPSQQLQQQQIQKPGIQNAVSNFKSVQSTREQQQPFAQQQQPIHQNAGSILISSLGEEQGCQVMTTTSHGTNTNNNIASCSAISPITGQPDSSTFEQVSSSVELVPQSQVTGGSSGLLKDSTVTSLDDQIRTQVIGGQQIGARTQSTNTQNMDLVEVVTLAKREQKFAQTGNNKREYSSSLVREVEQSSIENTSISKVSPIKDQSSFLYNQRQKRDQAQKSLFSQPHAQFNLKRLSQGTSQSMNLIGQSNELFNSVVLSKKSREQNGHRSVAQFLSKPSTVAAHTISSKTKTQRRSLQRNTIAQKYSTSARSQVQQTNVSTNSSIQAQAALIPRPGSRNLHEKKRSFEGTKMHMMLSASSRSGLLNQSNTSMALSHARSHTQFKQLASFPKRMTLSMNKVSSRPAHSLTKGIVNISDSREQEFFKSVRPLINGGKFYIAMDSGNHIEQNVYLNVDLLSLHIESTNMSTCAEIIHVKQLFKTELPPATLEQIRVYQKSPDDFSKVQQLLYEFNLHVVENATNTTTANQKIAQNHELNASSQLEKSQNNQQSRQYRVKLAATSYEQLKEWIVGINLLIKEKQNLSRLASLIELSIEQ